MHRLLGTLAMKERVGADIWRLALYFGGIFYMINPFTYSRFMAGQWLFLLGYAMLPFFVRSLLKFFAAPTFKTSLMLAAWAFAVVTASVHHIAMLALIALLVPILATVFKYWKGDKLKRYVTWSGATLGIVAVLFSYWIVPALFGHGAIGTAVTSRGGADFSAFATSGSGALGPIGEVVRLQGFWADARQLYTLPQNIVPAWGLLFLLLWVLVIYGAAKAWKASRLLVAFAGSCIILGVILAASPLMQWASQILPLLSGYREPDKFANLIAIGYSLLGTLGIAFAAQRATSRFKEAGSQAVLILGLLLPIAITPSMLWGFGSQLKPRDYPAGWSEMNTKLRELPGAKHVLFLPWHQYMGFGFSGRIIATPAEKYFEVPVIASDDPEFEGITPTNPDPEKAAIKQALGTPETLTRTLVRYRINYILLAKEEDADSYAYLDHQPDMRRIGENDNLTLYEVQQ